MRPRYIAAAILAAVSGCTVPSMAAAQSTVTVDQKCYTPGDTIVETGAGFTPNAPVQETLTLVDALSTPLATLTAPLVTTDALGSFTRMMRAPELAQDWDVTETAMDAFAVQANTQLAPASVQWTLSQWDVGIAQWMHGRANPARQMTVRAHGWTTLGSTLYAHYYLGQRRVKTAKVGGLTGDCGDLTAHMKQFPFRHVKRGLWTVWFSATRRFDKAHDAAIYYRVRVR